MAICPVVSATCPGTTGVKKTEDEIARALTGNYRPEHVFALKQALALYDFYTAQLVECDAEIERQFSQLAPAVPPDDLPPLDTRDKRGSHSKNAPAYDARSLLYRWAGVDLVAISGLNESTVQTILSEIGTDMTAWPTDKHFGSWLGLAPITISPAARCCAVVRSRRTIEPAKPSAWQRNR